MCGIYGRFGADINSCPNQDDLSSLRVISHRGPDGSGFSAGKNYVLGHARLSILDQSVVASQPLPSPSGRYLLSFNGEIYNYGALFKRYFKSARPPNSDTIVLSQLIDSIGLSVISELRGMFGIVLLDTVKNKVHLIRDHFGQKQIYYHFDNKSLRIASEIKALLPNRKFGLNFLTMYEYLANGVYDHSNRTFVEDIFSVEPGEIVSIDLDGLSTSRQKFWNLTGIGSEDSVQSTYCVDELQSLLSDVVQGALHGDFSHAISLSGGLDGAALLALSKKSNLLSKIDRAYTIAFEEFSEVPEAKEIAKHFGVPHEVVNYTATDFFDQITETIISQEGPIGGLMNSGLQSLAAGVSAAGYKTLIGGMGVDELFGGYTSLNPKYFQSRLNGSVLIDGSKGALGNAVFTKAGLAKVKGFEEREMICDSPREMQIDLIKTSKLPRNLRMLDRLSMKSGLEMRSPFLDVDVLEYSLKIPVRDYYDGELGKMPIRKCLSEDLPRFLLEAPKTSVQAPQRQWLMKKNFADLFGVIINDTKFFDKYGLNCNFYGRLYMQAQLDGAAQFPLWQLLNIWLLNSWVCQA